MILDFEEMGNWNEIEDGLRDPHLAIGNSWYQRLEMLHVRVPLRDLHTNPRPQYGRPLHLLGALGLNIRGLTRLRDKDLFGVLKADHPIGGLFVQLTLIK